MTIDEMRTRKKALGFTNQMIADRTGIPLSTVQKIFAGATTSPRRDTLAALEKLLSPNEGSHYGEMRPASILVRESAAGYGNPPSNTSQPHIEGKQALKSGIGPYTLKDYLELPVLIWDGACRIDLGEMYETISFLWESN